MIAYGTSHWGCTESLDQLKKEYNVEVDYLRLRGYPFSKEVIEFIDKHERTYVVDQNRDGQMLQLLRLELSAGQIAKLRSVRHYNGLPLDARSVTDEIITQEGK
jgi:2-oxoglutarate/2-oxoacid ferredoxin oxidoreductase subunit alpha